MIGCGDTFRPIIIPNPPTFPNPAAAHTVVSLNDNGATVAGSAMSIDVSGDSVSSIVNTDIHPVHAVQQSANEVLALNQAVTGTELPGGKALSTSTCLVTVGTQIFNVCPSLTSLNFLSTSIGGTSTITLPFYSSPNFVAVAPSATTAYVTLPTYPTDPTNPLTTIVPSVGIVSIGATSRGLVGTVPVATNPSTGANPYALAVTPDNTKLYVADDSTPCPSSTGGVCSVNAFNTNNTDLTLSTRGVTGSLSSPPIWLAARSDSQAVYALEANGTLAYISVVSTTGPDVLTESSISAPGALYMLYDGNGNRLYIPWFDQSVTPAQGELTIVDVSQSVPQPLAKIDIPPFTTLNIQQAYPATASAVTVLPDESRAYVASSAVLPTNISITSVSGDGTTATFAYTLTSGQNLNPGMSITVSGTNIPSVIDFDGTYIVSALVSGTATCPGTCFQAGSLTSGTWPQPPATGPASGTGNNIFPQVTVVNVSSNTIKTTAAIPGFAPYDAFCGLPVSQGGPRFRLTMAAGGDSTRAYLASCDGGTVNIIDTSDDSYVESQPVPASTRTGSGGQNLPQNPVFLLAGP